MVMMMICPVTPVAWFVIVVPFSPVRVSYFVDLTSVVNFVVRGNISVL
jgi:hypothetical protein